VLSQWVNPESVRRGIVSDIMRVFEDRRFRLSALQLMNVTVDQLATVYINFVPTAYWGALVAFQMQGPGIAMVIG
jgi:nucleoside diphosphate kinase